MNMADGSGNSPSTVPSGVVARTARGDGGRSGNRFSRRYRASGQWQKFRRAFTRQSIYSAFKTLLWAAPLTVMIWIYAERDGVDTVKGYNLVIGLRNNDLSHRVLRLESPKDGRIRVDLTGPRALMESVQKKLSNATEPLVRIDVDSNLSPGPHSISIASIGNDTLFVENGITVGNPDPGEITVDVDQLDQIDLDVQAPASANLASPPAFEPRKVRVRIPHSLLAGNGKYAAVAQLDSFPDIKTPGTHDLTNVPVAIVGPSGALVTDPAATVTPTFVSAKIEVKNSDETYTIPSVPVWPLYPPGEKYDAKLGDPTSGGVLPMVKVVGPHDQIEALKSPDFSPRPFAWFVVNPSDQQTETDYHASLQLWGLPDGVHVSSDDQRPTISYKLVDRSQ
jgi:hypothetical protein